MALGQKKIKIDAYVCMLFERNILVDYVFADFSISHSHLYYDGVQFPENTFLNTYLYMCKK